MDVLCFVSDGLRFGLDNAIANRLGINALRSWYAAPAADVEIGLEIKTATFSAHYAFVLADAGNGEFHLKTESCTIGTEGEESQFKTQNGKWIKRPANIGVPALQSSALLLPLVGGIGPYKQLYDFLTGMSFYNIFPDQLKAHQKLINAHPLEENGQNLASLLRALKRKQSAQELISAFQYVIGHINDYQITPSGRRQMIQLKHGANGTAGPWFELAQESDGTLRMLAILTALHQQPPRTLIALEEPELNVHPRIMAKLWDEIVAASQHTAICLVCQYSI